MLAHWQNAPGGWPANNEPPNTGPVANEQCDRVILDEDFREGKFEKLSSFMTIAENNPHPRYLSAIRAALKSRDIIHISDKDKSRLHDRIMLILEAFSDNMRCLEFCRHEQTRADSSYHWNVRVFSTDHTPGQDNTQSFLDVQLKPHGPLASNITINTRDIWNVEKEVNVAILGRVEFKSMLKLLEKIVPALAFSLYAAVNRTDEQRPPSRDNRQPHRGANRGSWGQDERRRELNRAKDERNGAFKFFENAFGKGVDYYTTADARRRS